MLAGLLFADHQRILYKFARLSSLILSSRKFVQSIRPSLLVCFVKFGVEANTLFKKSTKSGRLLGDENKLRRLLQIRSIAWRLYIK